MDPLENITESESIQSGIRSQTNPVVLFL